MSTSRERMLATIRASLASTRGMLETEAAKASHTPPPFVHPPAGDLADQFVAELTRLEVHAHRCEDDETALDLIATLLERYKAQQIIAWSEEEIGLPGLAAVYDRVGATKIDSVLTTAERKERLQALEPALVCLSGVDVAIAESGSLVILHGPRRARLASLLAPTHIAVVRRSQLVRGLGEAIMSLKERYGPDLLRDSSNLTIISGPSRTADIEFTLTLGIHGPRDVHVVLIEE